MRLLLFILTACIICLSCKKDNVKAGETVEIYLLKNNQTITGKCQIDPAVATLQDTAIVKNQDILEYYKANNQFALSDNSMQKMRALADRTPLAVVVDKQVVYYAILKPSYSSSSCTSSITVDYVGTGNRITMNLGYAGADLDIDDQRNNPKLLATLKNQGKLR